MAYVRTMVGVEVWWNAHVCECETCIDVIYDDDAVLKMGVRQRPVKQGLPKLVNTVRYFQAQSQARGPPSTSNTFSLLGQYS